MRKCGHANCPTILWVWLIWRRNSSKFSLLDLHDGRKWARGKEKVGFSGGLWRLANCMFMWMGESWAKMFVTFWNVLGIEEEGVEVVRKDDDHHGWWEKLSITCLINAYKSRNNLSYEWQLGVMTDVYISSTLEASSSSWSMTGEEACGVKNKSNFIYGNHTHGWILQQRWLASIAALSLILHLIHHYGSLRLEFKWPKEG